MTVKEATRVNSVSSSFPGGGCGTRRDFYDLINTMRVCAAQSQPLPKRLDGRRCRAAVNVRQDFRKAMAALHA